MELQTPVQYIKGIGPKRAEDLSSRSIFTVEDLVYNLPYRYEDRSRFTKVKELQPGEHTSILVEVLTSGLVITRKTRLRIFDLAARDTSGLVRCKWFHSEYLDKKKIFHPGQKVIFYGKFEVGDVDRVLNGDLDPFIKVYLVSRRDAGKAAPVKPA